MQTLGLDVWQLDGGILNYFKEIPDAQTDWQGDCFVFDNRVAVNPALQESGTSIEQVFDENIPDEAWRKRRALRLKEVKQSIEPSSQTVTPKGD